MKDAIMETVENGNGKIAIGATVIGLAGTGLGVLGKIVYDKVKIKLAAKKEADSAEPVTEETTK